MNKLFIFVLGAATGSLVTWKLVEAKYKKMADEEIESVKEYYYDRLDKLEADLEDVGFTETEAIENDHIASEMKKEYDEIATLYAENQSIGTYVKENEDEGFIQVEPGEERIEPYVIAPEEYGEDGHEAISLMYYTDGVLADDNDEIISDPESIIGDALSHFGEYEDDCVHVRNENTGCDYEILLSEKTFSEVYKGDN